MEKRNSSSMKTTHRHNRDITMNTQRTMGMTRTQHIQLTTTSTPQRTMTNTSTSTSQRTASGQAFCLRCLKGTLLGALRVGMSLEPEFLCLPPRLFLFLGLVSLDLGWGRWAVRRAWA
jgi:hypothetical protein